jgi:predicted Zn-ribbon and HTH transcriptional regulator
MPGETLKDKLINKIKETDDPALLEEISNLFELQEPEAVYQTSDKQKKVIEDARQQVRNKETLTDEQADKDIDEWLNK